MSAAVVRSRNVPKKLCFVGDIRQSRTRRARKRVLSRDRMIPLAGRGISPKVQTSYYNKWSGACKILRSRASSC